MDACLYKTMQKKLLIIIYILVDWRKHFVSFIFCFIPLFQQAGGTIVMDADATASLHRKAVASTDDKFKFIWFKVCESIILSKYVYVTICETIIQLGD